MTGVEVYDGRCGSLGQEWRSFRIIAVVDQDYNLFDMLLCVGLIIVSAVCWSCDQHTIAL